MEIISLLLAPVALISFIWLIITAFKKSLPWGFWVLLGPLLLSSISFVFIQPNGIISILVIALTGFIPSISFAYTCWEEAQKPFLTYIISATLSLLLSVSSLASLGDETLEDLISQTQRGMISELDAAKRMQKLIQQMENNTSLSEQEKLSIRTAQNIIKQVEKNLSNDPDYYNRDSEEGSQQNLAAREAQRKKEEAIKKLQEKLNQRKTNEKTQTAKKPLNLPTIKKSEVRKYLGSTVIIITLQGLQHKGILKDFDEAGYSVILEKERKTGKLQFKIHMSDIKKILLYIDE